MSERFGVRWKRLADSARRPPVREPRGPRPGWVEQVARRALLARTTGAVRTPEPLAWAGLASLAAAAAVAVLVWPGPVVSTAEALSAGAGALARAVPHAPPLPRSPAPPRPPLPGRDATLAAVSRLPELRLDLPFLPHRIETP